MVTVTKIIQWVSITALLLAVAWRLSTYQIRLDLVVGAGAVLVLLALFYTKQRIETHLDSRSNLGKQVTVRL